MIYYILQSLIDDFHLLNVFRYLTFTGIGAILTSLIICFLTGPSIIKWLKSKQKTGQPIRDDGPKNHILKKKGTPTMGGVMILLSVFLSTLIWGDITNHYIWLLLFVMLGFGGIGFTDDYLKLSQKNSKGLSGRSKLLGQIMVAVLTIVSIQSLSVPEHSSHLTIPIFKDVLIDLGWFYIPFAIIVIVGSSNAVNLTDGLDGLAIVPIMITSMCFGLIAYLVGHSYFSDYLHLYPVQDAGEIAIFCVSLVGAGLGFLWFNAPPAKVFMGDTGSLAFGGVLGSISVITKHELVLAIIGGLFVVEAMSVMIQVYYFKLSGKRFFGMAPIHHHFEKKGWSEPTIVIRFWIISVICALIGLATLKLR